MGTLLARDGALVHPLSPRAPALVAELSRPGRSGRCLAALVQPVLPAGTAGSGATRGRGSLVDLPLYRSGLHRPRLPLGAGARLSPLQAVAEEPATDAGERPPRPSLRRRSSRPRAPASGRSRPRRRHLRSRSVRARRSASFAGPTACTSRHPQPGRPPATCCSPKATSSRPAPSPNPSARCAPSASSPRPASSRSPTTTAWSTSRSAPATTGRSSRG